MLSQKERQDNLHGLRHTTTSNAKILEGKPLVEHLSLALSYRPVALTSLLCRLAERVVLRRVEGTLSLPTPQYGYRKGFGPDVALAHLATSIQDGFRYSRAVYLGNKKYSSCQLRTLVAALDLSDAFCHVHKNCVVTQYLSHGGDPAYAWFLHDFLSDRTIRTRVGRYLFHPWPLECGTPQGSILGPLSWSLASIPLVEKLQQLLPRRPPIPHPADYHLHPENPHPMNGVIFYVDDSVVWLTGYDVPAKCRLLSTILESSFHGYSETYGIPVPPKSAVHLFYKRSLPPAEEESIAATPVRCGLLTLPVQLHAPMRFLGILLDHGLTWLPHFHYVMGMCATRLLALQQLQFVLNPYLLRVLYLGAVHSLLLYGCILWAHDTSPSAWASLEQVHLAGARCITGVLSSTPNRYALLSANLLPLPTASRIAAVRVIEKVRRLPPSCPAVLRVCGPAPPGHLRHTVLPVAPVRLAAAHLPGLGTEAFAYALRPPPMAPSRAHRVLGVHGILLPLYDEKKKKEKK